MQVLVVQVLVGSLVVVGKVSLCHLSGLLMLAGGCARAACCCLPAAPHRPPAACSAKTAAAAAPVLLLRALAVAGEAEAMLTAR